MSACENRDDVLDQELLRSAHSRCQQYQDGGAATQALITWLTSEYKQGTARLQCLSTTQVGLAFANDAKVVLSTDDAASTGTVNVTIVHGGRSTKKWAHSAVALRSVLQYTEDIQHTKDTKDTKDTQDTQDTQDTRVDSQPEPHKEEDEEDSAASK